MRSFNTSSTGEAVEEQSEMRRVLIVTAVAAERDAVLRGLQGSDREKKGLLKRVPCSEDRRVTYAEITDAGRELFDEIFPRHVSSIHTLMNGLDKGEKDQAIELLKKLGKGV